MLEQVRRQAREAYALFRDNPGHPGLQFKKVNAARPIYSTRINRDHRAVGILTGNEIVWFWIGQHDAYEKLLDRL